MKYNLFWPLVEAPVLEFSYLIWQIFWQNKYNSFWPLVEAAAVDLSFLIWQFFGKTWLKSKWNITLVDRSNNTAQLKCAIVQFNTQNPKEEYWKPKENYWKPLFNWTQQNQAKRGRQSHCPPHIWPDQIQTYSCHKPEVIVSFAGLNIEHWVRHCCGSSWSLLVALCFSLTVPFHWTGLYIIHKCHEREMWTFSRSKWNWGSGSGLKYYLLDVRWISCSDTWVAFVGLVPGIEAWQSAVSKQGLPGRRQ